MNKSIEAVITERTRQIEVEGFGALHDSDHAPGDLACAGVCYAERAVQALQHTGFDDLPAFWPWDERWWKPKDTRRNLVIAAALIIAEIDRMDLSQALRGMME